MSIRICWDLDGVLAQTCDHLIQFLIDEGKLEKGTTGGDCAKWDLLDSFDHLTFDDLKAHFLSPEFWSTIPTYEWMPEFTHVMRKHGASNYVVTDRCWFPELIDITKDWLVAHNFAIDEFFIVPSKDKGQVAETLQANYFVEDRVENAILVAPHVDASYIIERPWNMTEEQLPKNCFRTNCFSIWRTLRLAATMDVNLSENWIT